MRKGAHAFACQKAEGKGVCFGANFSKRERYMKVEGEVEDGACRLDSEGICLRERFGGRVCAGNF